MAGKAFHIPCVAVHLIASAYVDQTYCIQVQQPLMRNGGNERFPALYISDANSSFDFAKDISLSLQAAGEVRPFMLVGIGYPGHNPYVGNILRRRDFTSERRAEVAGLPTESPIEGVPGFGNGAKTWGGASEFLAFVGNQLTGFIDENYPTIKEDRGYAGHSLGGELGLHALFSHPGLFNRYVLGSASLSYDGDDYGIREAQEFVASGKPLDARLFMAVGELEEFDPAPAVARPQFVSSFCKLLALLTRAQIRGLEFTGRIFAGESHASVWPVAFSHGVRTVYGPADHSPQSGG